MAALAVALAGCGSTKVYTTDKTVVYKSATYNMANVQRIAPRIEGALPDGSTVDMGAMDKKAVESLLKEHSSLTVTTSVEMDQQSMIYQRATVKSYSDFNKLARNLDGAMKDINKFMADKKKTQLKLR
ncbi:MAG: hypothetical protein PVJ33_17105 [Lysobacterales bacterium]|jgi:hypothetical protein